MNPSTPGITNGGERPTLATSEVEVAPPIAPMKTRRVLLLGIATVLLLVVLLAVGILPRRSLQRQITGAAASASSALPIVAAATAQRPSNSNALLLPGTMEALHEAALYARVSGYVRQWYADIGTRVHAGQLLAEIDAPELEQSVLQARAQLAQMQSALVLAQANLARWRLLAADSAVTVQEYQVMQQANDAAVASVRAAEANLRGLTSTLRYAQVRAPFNGVVTARNVDYGALITAAGASSTPLTAGGSELATASSVAAASLFRIAQTDTMRVYISVPQPYVASIRPGLGADLVVEDLGGRAFRGKVVRAAGAIDPNSRTLLAEVDVPNSGEALLPGMYAQVSISLQRVDALLQIPSTALVTRSSGPQVMELSPTDSGRATVHFRDVQVARDLGSTLEIVSGLNDGALVATIGSQIFTEGQKVRIAPADSVGADGAAGVTRLPVTSSVTATGRTDTAPN